MSMVLICSRCREKESMTRCEMCLDKSTIVDLCGDCFGPHYRIAHGVLTNPEEEKKMLEHVKKSSGVWSLTIEDMRKAIKEAGGIDKVTLATDHAKYMKKLLDSIKLYQPSLIKRPTFDEMHSSVRFDMDSHPDVVINKKNDKRRGKAKQAVDMEIVANYIREKLLK